MNIYKIIEKKRDGRKLDKSEIDFFINEYTEGNIPDYQASALLMAMFLKGLDGEETVQMTLAMRDSGDILDLSVIKGIKVDKHSTGGVGDKTTLIAAPLAAACGVPVAKMSGRGLGFTGGTVDKLESIPGFQTAMEERRLIEQVNRIGISITGQTGHIAPADKKIYALRDVTATVDNLNLITASIMSKKLALGSDAIVLDVKTGNGAFMEKQEDAEKLAELMVDIGKSAGKNTIALVTDMSQPLGNAVGNSLEVIEAIETLKCRGPKDITELSVKLAGIMIFAGGRAESADNGEKMAEDALVSGLGINKLREFIEAQCGRAECIDDYSIFEKAAFEINICAETDGYITEINAHLIGLASQHAGAGRETKEDSIDPAAGVLLAKKIGASVKKGELLGKVYSNNKGKTESAARQALKAYVISESATEAPQLVKKIIN